MFGNFNYKTNLKLFFFFQSPRWWLKLEFAFLLLFISFPFYDIQVLEKKFLFVRGLWHLLLILIKIVIQTEIVSSVKLDFSP